MSDFDKQKGARSIFERILEGTALLSGITMIAMMLLVTISVFFRYTLNQPILGSQELVQMGMVLVVMLAMPYTAYHSLHIRVDIFDKLLGRVGRYVCDIIARALGIGVLAILVNKAWDKALDAHEYEDVSNMLQLPFWVAYAAISIGMACYALVLAYQLYRQLGNWSGYDE